MNGMRRYLSVVGVLLLFLVARAQPTDSLFRALVLARADGLRIELLEQLSLEYRKANIDSAMKYAQGALALSEATDELTAKEKVGHRVNGLNMVGTCHAMQGNLEAAFGYFHRSLALNMERKDKRATVKSLNNLGNTSLFAAKLDDALSYYLQSLQLAEELKLPKDIAATAGNIGIVYHRLGQKEKAIDYYQLSIRTNDESGNARDNSEVSVNMGLVHGDMGNDSLNLLYQLKALKLFEQEEDLFGQARVYNNIALIYERKEDYDRALELYSKAVALREESGHVGGNTIVYHNIGLIHTYQKQFGQAILFLNKSREMAEASKDYYLLQEIYLNLANAYAQNGDPQKAFELMQLQDAAKDSVYNATSSERIAEMQTRYETEQKDMQILLLEAETEKDEALLVKRNLLIAGLIVGIVLVLLTGAFFINRYRVRQQQQREIAILETKQQERIRIARDMHDDIGAGLTRISLGSERAKMELQGDGGEQSKVRQQLDRLAAESRALTRSLGEIIWTMNPRNDMLDHLFAYIRNYAYDFLEGAGVQCRIEFPDLPRDKPLGTEVRRNIFLIVKEALNNTVKHAEATEVILGLEMAGGYCTLMIRDNGKGIHGTGGGNGGNGLANMKKRGAELGARLRIESAEGQGTTILLENIPLEISRK
jgi:signal transduction histidine kinase